MNLIIIVATNKRIGNRNIRVEREELQRNLSRKNLKTKELHLIGKAVDPLRVREAHSPEVQCQFVTRHIRVFRVRNLKFIYRI